MESLLPEGWTLARVQVMAGCPTADFMPTSTLVFLETHPDGEPVRAPERIAPEVIIRIGDYALVKPAEEPDWYMGQVLDDAVVCWASYGPQLGLAILAL